METEIRDPKELSADIDRFTLESEIRREVKYTAANIPALKRENAADLKRLKRLDADSPEAVRLRDATRARAWKVTQLKKHKNSIITETRTERVPRERGIDALKAHIRANWTIREILLFKDFTHGGVFFGGECDDGARYRWRINFAGYVADTADGQRNLVRLFEALKTEAWTLIGVKTYQNLERGAPPALILCRADADEDSPLDMTPEALLRSIPNADGIGELLAQILAGVNHGNAVAERTYAATERNAAAIHSQGADVKRGADAAERAEKAALEMHDPAIACFNKMAARDKSKYSPRASKTRDPLLNAKDHAVYEKWNEFSTGEADPELPDGTFRRASGRRDFDEFIAVCQNVIVFNGKTLGELYPDDGGGVESIRQAIERERKRRARAEESAKATPPCPPRRSGDGDKR